MVPIRRSRADTSPAAPRTRGDGPWCCGTGGRERLCSPHPRGWSSSRTVPEGCRGLLPAPAGMVPVAKRSTSAPLTAPRTRGDGPSAFVFGGGHSRCSPHPRGWSQRVAAGKPGVGLLPAPAGMVPPPTSEGPADDRLLPAPAGMVPLQQAHPRPVGPAPRTCGDGPGQTPTGSRSTPCSPHPRGWPPGRRLGSTQALLLPAPAGMAPSRRPGTVGGEPAPRTRGDGPCREWRAQLVDFLLPAPAGMVPGNLFGFGTESTDPAPAGMVPLVLQWCLP